MADTNKELLEFGKRCVANTNYSRLPEIKPSVMDGMVDVIESDKVKNMCARHNVELSLNTIYAVFTSYCKFAVYQLNNNVKDFHFPLLGSFVKRQSLLEEIGSTKGLSDEQITKDRRVRTLKHLKHFDPLKMKELLKLKKKQWKL